MKIIYPLLILTFVFAAQQQTAAQEKKPLSLNDIEVKLTFTSRISKSAEQINNELTADIRKREVNFILEAEDEKLLRNADANDLLIKAIRESLPKEIEKDLLDEKEKIALYEKYVDNYKGTIEQKSIAVRAAEEYLEKYGKQAEPDLVEFLKKAITILKKQIADKEKIQY